MIKKLRERSSINVITGLLFQVINTILGIALPYLFITNFGSETNGLLSSIGQFFVYLGMLEAGVGTATIQALYKPIAQNDRNTINRILSATNKYYIKTGVIYFVLVLLLGLVYPLFVKTSIPYSTVAIVVFLNGAGSIWGFFVQAKYVLLLKAEGKLYILNILSIITSVLKNVGKIVAIYLGYDLIVVYIVQFAVTVLVSSVILIYIRKQYEWIDLSVEPDYSSIYQKNAVLVQQITWIVFNHTDIMLLTLMTGDLVLVSIYSVYTLIYSSVQNLIDSVGNGFQYKIGGAAQGTTKAFFKYFEKYEIFYYFVGFSLNTIAYILTVPFLKLYVGNAKDGNYMMPYLPTLFLAVQVLNTVRGVNKQPIEGAGHFIGTRKISIGEAIINIITSFILVFRFKIYGVLIGTILALLFGTVMFFKYINEKIFKTFSFRRSGKLLIYLPTVVIVSIVGKNVFPPAYNYLQLILYAIPLSLVCAVIFGIESAAIVKRIKG